MTFMLLPAVDVAGGQAVQLVQGETGTETAYGAPRDAALAWQAGGAAWIHLVDLDAAFGRGSNAELLAAVVGELVPGQATFALSSNGTSVACLMSICAHVRGRLRSWVRAPSRLIWRVAIGPASSSS